jgi:thymidylate synthase ThyX
MKSEQSFPSKSVGGITVTLLNPDGVEPVVTASIAGHECYMPDPPDVVGEHNDPTKRLNVENNLFNPGHHSTIQHDYFQFEIEGIAIGDITLGFHLGHPFYTSDQRSGRFCADMFKNPNYTAISSYIQFHYPEVKPEVVERIMEYITSCISCYNDGLPEAKQRVRTHLERERPKIAHKDAACEKIAQEQMRMLIPIIFPTGMIHTMNLSTLIAIWECAWSPVMRSVTNMMRDLVVGQCPGIAFAFNPERRINEDMEFAINHSLSKKFGDGDILCEPFCEVVKEKTYVMHLDVAIPPKDMHPVDRLPYLPRYAGNKTMFITTNVAMSLATMGQDQRHRSIERTTPVFEAAFYEPPVLAEVDLRNEIKAIMNEWLAFRDILPSTLWANLAPYGSMVSYEKNANLNDLAHEQAKRLCFCAQEEIYHLALQLREDLVGKDNPILGQLFEPPCHRTGVCLEGKRYCGRDLKERDNDRLFFVKRKV